MSMDVRGVVAVEADILACVCVGERCARCVVCGYVERMMYVCMLQIDMVWYDRCSNDEVDS